MVTGQGRIRSHWGGILGALSALGEEVVAERVRRLDLAAQEEGGALTWRCDPVPLPLLLAEFEALERGLAQRAALLEAVLADIYGAQALLADGSLPAALVQANPNYQRACRAAAGGVPSPMLQCLAVDLVRDAEGAWRVFADRTGGAPGIGYAREHRRLLAQIMPELFRNGQVRQLRPFFEAWQDALPRLGTRSGPRAPVVAMLTRGPADPHWPEHLALSRDLACALVEPRDLTVRGGVLSIKALQGLQAVDVLFRRMPGGEIDPLELPGPSGVTGMLDAARSGSVRIVNHPGAEVVEAAGFAAVMPGLARRLLGEELLLHGHPMTGSGGSVAPCIVQGRLVPQPVTLRMFLMHDGAGWRTMPGGVARVAGPEDGAVFKDVWVMREDAGVIQGPEAVPQAAVAIRRTAVDMPSRVADDFFWLGRYVERLEAQVRVGRAGLVRRARGAPLPREIAELGTLQRCLEVAGFGAAATGGVFEERLRAALAPDGTVDRGLFQAERLVEALRDRMTVETHGAFIHALRGARADVGAALRGGRGLDGLMEATAGVQGVATTVAGVAAEGMVRGGGRLFLDLGRRMERASVTAQVLSVVLDQPAVRMDGALRLVLELCDSAITYRGRYFSLVQPAPVLDLVLADTGNPRALAFQFEAAATLLEVAGDAELAGVAAGLQQRAAALVNQVQSAAEPAREAGAIAPVLRGMGEEVSALSDRITRRFFALLPKLQAVGRETA